jgi:phage baseplate assembly protein gpV
MLHLKASSRQEPEPLPDNTIHNQIDRRHRHIMFLHPRSLWLLMLMLPLSSVSPAVLAQQNTISPVGLPTTSVATRQVQFILQAPQGSIFPAETKLHVFSTKKPSVLPAPLQVARDGKVPSVNLAVGKYDIWLETTGELAAKKFDGVEIGAGTGVQAVILEVPPAVSIQGNLFLNDGKSPAAKYFVGVQSATFPTSQADNAAATFARGAQEAYAQAEVRADGQWTLNGLAPGSYIFDVRKPGETLPFATLPPVVVKANQLNDVGRDVLPGQGWEWLFNGQLHHGGKPSDFGAPSAMKIEGEHLVLGTGNDMTGVTWTENLPRQNYEISLDAMRVEGQDFFCGLTFPVGESPLTFIVGGWGGRVVGLSNVDWLSAAENETGKGLDFETGRWYRVRLRVTTAKVEAWINTEKMVDLPIKGRQLSIRNSVEASLPLGIATWQTTGWLRDVRLRRLDTAEVKAIEGTLPPEAEF